MPSSNRIQNFVASRCGLQFINSFPHEPDVAVNLAAYGDVKIGDASNGLCGGMVFTVRDLYEFHRPALPDTTPPAPGTPLFNYLVSRLLASFNLPDGVLKYFEWMNTPDADTNLWIATRHGVSWHTIVEEWPKVKADIDSGHLSPLGLVTVLSPNPIDLGQNHEVLAYGYDLDEIDNLTLHVYDPNTDPALADGVVLRLNLSQPAQATPINHNINIAHPVRGFVRVPYSPHDPSVLEPAAAPVMHAA